MKTTCIIHVRGGVIQNLPDIEKACYTLKEGRYLMEVFEHNRRSNQQNRYYFGLVVPLIQKGLNDMGHDFTKEEVHEFLKSKFKKRSVNPTTSLVGGI